MKVHLSATSGPKFRRITTTCIPYNKRQPDLFLVFDGKVMSGNQSTPLDLKLRSAAEFECKFVVYIKKGKTINILFRILKMLLMTSKRNTLHCLCNRDNYRCLFVFGSDIQF